MLLMTIMGIIQALPGNTETALSWGVLGTLGGICLTLGGGLIAFGRRQGSTDAKVRRNEKDVQNLANAHHEHETRCAIQSATLESFRTTQVHQGEDIGDIKKDVKSILKQMTIREG